MVHEVNQDALAQYKRMKNMNDESYGQSEYLPSSAPTTPTKRSSTQEKKTWGNADYNSKCEDWVGGFSPTGQPRRSWKIKEKK